MFCYIQEIDLKRYEGCSTAKNIEVYESNWSSGNDKKTYYGWRYSNDKFERSIKKSYKISIHDSYRDKSIKLGNNVKKKQFHICNMSYYDFIDYSFFDCHMESRIKDIAEQLDTTSEHLYELIYDKINPLQQKIADEYEASEEGKERQHQKEILNKYHKNKAGFTKKYDIDEREYDYCYDVFGVLRNQKYRDKLILDSQWKKEYERKSQEESSRYYKQYYSNYTNEFPGKINVTTDNKEILKQFYRILSKKYHPDANTDKDTSEEMKLINQLKAQWGV